MLRNLRLVALSLTAVAVAAALPLPVPGLWGQLFLMLWAATLAGARWGSWQAGTAVLLLLGGTLFNLPLILGEGGARYLVWEVGSRALPTALSAWMAGWLLRRRATLHRSLSLMRMALILLLSTVTATAVVAWLQRGSQVELLPVTVTALALASLPAAMLLRAVASVRQSWSAGSED